jgi:heat shock protein HslJ
MLPFRRQFQALLFVSLLALAVACSPSLPIPGDSTGEDPARGSAEATEPPHESLGLDKAEWVLERYGPAGEEVGLLPGSTVTLHFEDGRLDGTAGCNGYFGDYQLAGDSLTVGTLGSTEMWCEGLMDQESAYLNLLRAVETAAREGDSLILTGPAGRLVFAEQAPVDEQALLETVWELQTIVNDETARSVLAGSQITIEFEPGRRVSGNAGCNSYSSTYMLDEKGLGFHIFTTTLMACQNQELMDQETLFLKQLQAADWLSLEDEQLVISSDEGELIFGPASHLSLEGTDWVLAGISTGDAVVQTWIDETITARFEAGQATGSAGCNSYFADYEIDGGHLTLGPVASTRKACSEEIMQRETEFLTALGQVALFETRLDTLRLYDGAGKLLLQFEAAP